MSKAKTLDGRMMSIKVNSEELEMILSALQHYPDPESIDFGPAYEIRHKKAQQLIQRLMNERSIPK